jgi:uncharacterized membrane protein YphA (DoxX/SURF4 family)
LFSLGVRILVGGIFIFSGWGKLMTPHQNFMLIIEQYQFLTSSLIEPVSLILPWIELAMGVFFLVGYLSKVSASVLGLLLISFVILLVRAIALQIPIEDCGCFGSAIKLAPWQALTLDLGLLGLTGLSLRYRTMPMSLDGFLAR